MKKVTKKKAATAKDTCEFNPIALLTLVIVFALGLGIISLLSDVRDSLREIASDVSRIDYNTEKLSIRLREIDYSLDSIEDDIDKATEAGAKK